MTSAFESVCVGMLKGMGGGETLRFPQGKHILTASWTGSD